MPLSELPHASVSPSLSCRSTRATVVPSFASGAPPCSAEHAKAARMRARDVAPPFAHTLAASAITGSDAPPSAVAAGAVPLYLLAASRQREVPDGARGPSSSQHRSKTATSAPGLRTSVLALCTPAPGPAMLVWALLLTRWLPRWRAPDRGRAYICVRFSLAAVDCACASTATETYWHVRTGIPSALQISSQDDLRDLTIAADTRR